MLLSQTNVYPRGGVLIVKDPKNTSCLNCKRLVPGILGMNILRDCYRSLFEKHGSTLFFSPHVESAAPAFRCASERVEAILNSPKSYKVKVHGSYPSSIRAGTLSMVPVSCLQSSLIDFLLEPLGVEDGNLPEGLLVSRTLVCAEGGGCICAYNYVGVSDIWLSPRRVIGTVQAITLSSESVPYLQVSFESMAEHTVHISAQNVVTSPVASATLEIPVFPGLTEEDAVQARTLFSQYHTIFSQTETDLGCTSLIIHHIPLLDEAPVRQPYHRLPPSKYEVVKAHI